MIAKHWLLARVLGATLAVTACSLPWDPNHTLDRVRGGTMRVGYVVDTPWVTDSAGGAGGIEGSLVRALASDLRANIKWVPGTESELMESVSKRELDLAIGGFSLSSPWAKMVAFSRPYYTDTVAVGGAPGRYAPGTLEHLAVEIRDADPAAAQIRRRGGTPVPVPKLDTASGPVAAPTWRLAQLRRDTTAAIQLMQTKRALAASLGENAWLVAVERMIIARQRGIGAQLRSFRP